MLLVNLFLVFISVYGRKIFTSGGRRYFEYIPQPKLKQPQPSSGHGWDYTNTASWPGTCATGKAQSPINIDLGDLEDLELPPLEFHDYDVRGTVSALNNGHTEMVQGFTSWTKQPSISGGGLGARYILNQFHFHWSDELQYGSEHTVGEARYPLELHFVHIREDLNEITAGSTPGGMAVVTVFFQQSKDGTALFNLDMALKGTKALNQTANVAYYTPKALLPRDTSCFFRYNGSLTTPPCSEVVIWSIFSKPNHVTLSQLGTLRQHLENTQQLLFNNWRPVQPLNGRKIYMVKTKKTEN